MSLSKLLLLPFDSINSITNKGVMQNGVFKPLAHDANEYYDITQVTFDENNKYLYVVRRTRVCVYDCSSPLFPVVKVFTGSYFGSVTAYAGKVLVCDRTNIKLYDTTDNFAQLNAWENTARTTSDIYASAKLSQDGKLIIKESDTVTSIVELVDSTTFAVTHTFTKSTTNYKTALFVSATGKFVVYPNTNYGKATVFNVLTNTNIGEISVNNGIVGSVGVSLLDEDYMVIMTSPTHCVVINLSSTTSVVVDSGVDQFTYLFVNKSRDKLYLFARHKNTNTFRVHEYGLSSTNNTGRIDSFNTLYSAKMNQATPIPLENPELYKISDAISETLQLDDFTVTVTEIDTKSVTSVTQHQAGAFTVPLPTNNAVSVTITPTVNKGVWVSSGNFEIGDLVYSDNPAVNDWVYKCTQAGLSNTFAPAWQNTAGTQFADGAVIWEAVEPIQMPITNAPVVPSPI